MEKLGQFYGANMWEWKTGDNLIEVINWFNNKRNKKTPFLLYYLPVEQDTTFKIEGYIPQVEGKVYLGRYCNGKVYHPSQTDES
jgi:hypothetical protein